MFKQISTQATAFGLAAMVTLATLAGVNALAANPAGQEGFARIELPATTTIVIVGKRISLS